MSALRLARRLHRVRPVFTLERASRERNGTAPSQSGSRSLSVRMDEHVGIAIGAPIFPPRVHSRGAGFVTRLPENTQNWGREPSRYQVRRRDIVYERRDAGSSTAPLRRAASAKPLPQQLLLDVGDIFSPGVSESIRPYTLRLRGHPHELYP